MLRKIRIFLSTVFFVGITLLFLDFTGLAITYLEWMNDIQLWPAILALNVGVIVGLVVLTLVMGRVYCSVICPLGILQDIVAWIRTRMGSTKARHKYQSALNWLRLSVLVVFIALSFLGIAHFIEPYGMFGRIAANLLRPLYLMANNALAVVAENHDSYLIYSKEIIFAGVASLVVAVVTLVLIVALAWRGGRTWCSHICPVGTLLGFLSRFAWLKPYIDKDRCVNCRACAKKCKASCIDIEHHTIDYSRCVDCMDCLDSCASKAIHFGRPIKPATAKTTGDEPADPSRRTFIATTAVVAGAAALKAQEEVAHGGLAVIEDKEIPERATQIVPPGSGSVGNFYDRCTACQLCIAACPNDVLRPSSDLATLLKPVMQFNHGYCRPECNICAKICPTGSMKPITVDERASTQVGHAVWISKNCVATAGVHCGNCARHCPVGAITMVPLNGDTSENPVMIPAVNEEKCVGCGACEYLCPARPFSAIYVEGHERHRTL